MGSGLGLEEVHTARLLREAELRESVAEAALGPAHLRRVGAAAAGDPVVIPTEEVGGARIRARRVRCEVPGEGEGEGER